MKISRTIETTLYESDEYLLIGLPDGNVRLIEKRKPVKAQYNEVVVQVQTSFLDMVREERRLANTREKVQLKRVYIGDETIDIGYSELKNEWFVREVLKNER